MIMQNDYYIFSFLFLSSSFFCFLFFCCFFGAFKVFTLAILDCSYNYQIHNMGQQVGKLQQNNNRPREKRKGQKEAYLYRPPPLHTHIFMFSTPKTNCQSIITIIFFFKNPVQRH